MLIRNRKLSKLWMPSSLTRTSQRDSSQPSTSRSSTTPTRASQSSTPHLNNLTPKTNSISSTKPWRRQKRKRNTPLRSCSPWIKSRSRWTKRPRTRRSRKNWLLLMQLKLLS